MSGSHGSGGHRDSYRGSDGGRGGGQRRDGGGYGAGRDEYAPYPEPRGSAGTGGGYGTGGYATGGYESGGYQSGGYESGGYESGGYESGGYQSGGYESGGHPSGGQRAGGYRSAASGSGPYQRETGPYQTGSGSGQYGRDTGGYRTDSGGYRTESGGYRTGSGSYRAGSGGYRTGSHRVVRDRRTGRRWAVVLGGAAAAVAVCVLAAFVVLSGVGASGEDEGGRVVGSGASESSPLTKGERNAVPDSCTIVGQDIVDKLAPGSERTEAETYQSSDRRNQCVWGAYTGKNKRQLTVELRAIAAARGRTATDTATATFTSERTADESGKSLLTGQKLTEKRRLDDVGDDGYLVYSVDKGQGSGEAIGNVRLGNVLITIHYSGGNDGDPISSGTATDGAVEVARAVIQGLEQS
ncbi:hypothetical protein [Actinomadura livida]|uniref:DUF3558 domain-containing protein n=1 Tax=Actinomadura livida TaxID=79909 RepID=A0A7W7IJE7_9ACTN|nr:MULTISPECIES: hypothetical protein [Actinomadura]MBB4778168.1 hypothetical protein [Actinomadura catellatispora]GGU29279.1 hypothetical protein GCM10010208_62580 [Actinomadura livida]